MSVSDPHMQAHAHRLACARSMHTPHTCKISKTEQTKPSLPRPTKQTVAPALSVLNFLSCFLVSGSLSVQMRVYSTQLALPAHSALLWFPSFPLFLGSSQIENTGVKICIRGALVGGKTEIQTPAPHHNSCQCLGA